MNLPLEKQTVLVTGAGRGLGSAIARSFHREGAKVIINYRNSLEVDVRLRVHFSVFRQISGGASYKR